MARASLDKELAEGEIRQAMDWVREKTESTDASLASASSKPAHSTTTVSSKRDSSASSAALRIIRVVSTMVRRETWEGIDVDDFQSRLDDEHNGDGVRVSFCTVMRTPDVMHDHL